MPVGYLGDSAPLPECYPAAEGSPAGQRSARTGGKGKHTALEAAMGAAREPVLVSGVEAVAVRSLLRPPGTTVPTPPSWLPGSAAAAAAPVPGSGLAKCRLIAVRTVRALRVVAAVVQQHKGLLVVMGLKRVLASLRCCCLHKR